MNSVRTFFTLYKKNFLLFSLIPLLILVGCTSYFRFVVQHDYIVSFEGDCDPLEASCYIGCEDDECTEEYYYTVIERNAADLYNQCGPDITDCDEAYECGTDISCSVSYCDPSEEEEDTCLSVTEETS